MVFRVAVKLLEIHQYELMKRDNFEDIMNYMKGPIPDVDAATMDKIMRGVFSTDIRKQMAEYQVEYNVLQEEISTAQHYMESLNREKENYSHLESRYQVSFKRLPSNLNNFLEYKLISHLFSVILSVCRVKHSATRKDAFIATERDSSAKDASAESRNHR